MPVATVMVRRALLTFATCIALARITGAAPGRWKSSGPYGGVVTALEVSSADRNIVYVATISGTGFEGILINPEGPFRSTDGGRSWALIPGFGEANPGLAISEIDVDPDDPATLLITAGDAYRSTDAGETWRDIPTPASRGIQQLVFDPNPPYSAFATDGADIYRDSGPGGTWEKIDESICDSGGCPAFGVSIAVAGTEPSTLMASTTVNVFTSTDQGGSWKTAKTGIPDGLSIESLTVDPVRPTVAFAATSGGIYRTADSGSHWNITGPAESLAAPVYAIASGDIIAASSARSMSPWFISHDSGKTWLPWTKLPSTPFSNLVESSAGLVAGTGSGVVLASGQNPTWTSSNPGLQGLGVAAVTAAPSNLEVVYASTGTSTDSGESWKTGGDWDSITVDPANAQVVYATSHTIGLLGMSFGDVWKSTDEGADWIEVDSGLPETRGYVGRIEIPSTSSGALYLLAEDLNSSSCPGGGSCFSFGLYRSDDDAASWSRIGDTPLYVFSLAIDPVLTARMFVTDGPSVYGSTNGGLSWSPILQAPPGGDEYESVEVGFDSTSYVLRQSSAGVNVIRNFESVDPAGGGFLPAGSLADAMTVGTDAPGHLFVAAGSGGSGLPASSFVYESTDFGMSWTDISAGMPATNVNDLSVDSNCRSIYAATDLGVYEYDFPRRGIPITPISSITPGRATGRP